jgi:hypothetical protein
LRKEDITPEEIDRRKHDWGRAYLSKYTATTPEIRLFDAYKMTTRGKILSFLEYENKGEFLANSKFWRTNALAFQLINVVMVLLATASFIIATEPGYHFDPPAVCWTIDIISVVFFTFDYVTRFACAYNQLTFAIALFNIFDVLSFVPMYIEWIILAAAGHEAAAAVEILRFFRLFRVFRLMRLVQFSVTLKLVLKSIRQSTEGFILLILVIVLDLVFFSTTMYFVEGSYCWFDYSDHKWKYIANNQTTFFQSISATFWWNIVTITTVGYGDTFPVTPGGRMVASVAMVSGLVLLAFPIAIFGTNFHTLYEDWLSAEEEKELEVHPEKATGEKALERDVKMLQGKIDELQATIVQEQMKAAEHHRQMAVTMDKLFLSIMYTGKKEKKGRPPGKEGATGGPTKK